MTHVRTRYPCGSWAQACPPPRPCTGPTTSNPKHTREQFGLTPHLGQKPDTHRHPLTTAPPNHTQNHHHHHRHLTDPPQGRPLPKHYNKRRKYPHPTKKAAREQTCDPDLETLYAQRQQSGRTLVRMAKLNHSGRRPPARAYQFLTPEPPNENRSLFDHQTDEPPSGPLGKNRPTQDERPPDTMGVLRCARGECCGPGLRRQRPRDPTRGHRMGMRCPPSRSCHNRPTTNVV